MRAKQITFLLYVVSALVGCEPTTGSSAQPITAAECERDPEGCLLWMLGEPNEELTWEDFLWYSDIVDSGEKPPFGSEWLRSCKTCRDGEGALMCNECCLTVTGFGPNVLVYCAEFDPGNTNQCHIPGSGSLNCETTFGAIN